jgi:hypothetical protein
MLEDFQDQGSSYPPAQNVPAKITYLNHTILDSAGRIRASCE